MLDRIKPMWRAGAKSGRFPYKAPMVRPIRVTPVFRGKR
jgi:hypothetical protein